MRKHAFLLCLWVFCGVATFFVTGCGDDVKQVKTIERHEQEPVRMTSPGHEVVE